MSHRSTQALRPREALRALYALFRDPDDTAQVFTIISALSGRNRERMVRKLRATANGPRILAERQPLSELLSDRDRLSTMPEGSLGRAYVAFCEHAQITSAGLVQASMEGELAWDLSREERIVHERMRDAHDLWHVVLGYDTDLVGEASVLAFTVAQTRNPGIGLVVLMALARHHGEHKKARGTILHAFVRGLEAAWLPAADWEALLTCHIAEVRRALGVNAPVPYARVWPYQIFPDKALSAAS